MPNNKEPAFRRRALWVIFGATAAAGAVQVSSAFDDHASMRQKLGIRAMRPGPNPNDPAIYDEARALNSIGTLPDVFAFEKGGRVTKPSDWPKRRKEILATFEREIYGRIPKNVPGIRWEVVGVIPGMSAGVPTITRQLVGHVDNRRYPKVTVDIRASYTVPARATDSVPMIVEFGFGFGRPAPVGTKSWADQAIERGWGYATLMPNSIQPDNARLNEGIIGLCNQGRPRQPEDWGALRAWGWGLSRLIDYFEQTPESKVDAKKVAIEGVSRYGKAALVAQAFDERVAAGFIGSSGAGGAKLHRHVFGEGIENLAGGEFYWFAGNLIKYGASDPTKNVWDLPVDAHELIALCAPRPCFISYGVPEKGDAKWVDAKGSFLAGEAATPVYQLLGKQGFDGPMPPVNRQIGGELTWRQHDGGHEVTPNWPSFFDWASKYIPAPPLPTNRKPVSQSADLPTPRADANSMAAHQQLVAKAKAGGIDLYFLGDSITRRWGTSDVAYRPMFENWTKNFFGWNAGNFGWGADSTQHILWRIKNGELDGVHPKVIVLLAGTNNVGGGQSADDVVRGIRAIVKTCQEKAPKATLVLNAILPRNDDLKWIPVIQEANRQLAKLADGKRIRFVDIGPSLADAEGRLKPGVTVDQLHLSVYGYQIWADALRPILTDLLGPRKTTDTAPPPTGDPGIKG